MIQTCRSLNCCSHPHPTQQKKNHRFFDSEFLGSITPIMFFVSPRIFIPQNDKYQAKIWNQDTNQIGSGGSMPCGCQFEVEKIELECPKIYMGNFQFYKRCYDLVVNKNVSTSSYITLETPILLEPMENYWVSFDCAEGSKTDRLKITLVGTLTTPVELSN